MLLQTNSYVVPKDRRHEHSRLLRRFRQTLARLGCDHFEVYEQVGQNWSSGESSGRFVQIMRFRDRRHQLAVQAGERNDPQAQQLIAEFCELINFPYQQQHGLFAVGFYTSALPVAPARPGAAMAANEEVAAEVEIASAAAVAEATAAAEVPPPDQQTYVAQAAPPAEFSGEQVTPDDAPMAAAGSEDLGSAPQASEFHQEMEALGAQVEHEAPVLKIEPSDASADFPSEAASRVEMSESGANGEHAAGGNGAVADHETADAPDRPGNGESLPNDAATREPFDTLLDDHFGSEPSESEAAAEHEHISTGSGIGEVLDGGLLEDDELDVALPAQLIEDDLEPHAPDAKQAGGHAEDREPHRA